MMNGRSIRERLAEATKAAEAQSDSTRLATLRLINAAIRDRDIAIRAEHCAGDGAVAPDDAILQLLGVMVKQREDSARAYDEAGRLEQADRERAEIAVIRDLMPAPLSQAEAEAAVAETITEIGAGDLRDMGRVMARLKERYAGRMDFGRAGVSVRNALSGARA